MRDAMLRETRMIPVPQVETWLVLFRMTTKSGDVGKWQIEGEPHPNRESAAVDADMLKYEFPALDVKVAKLEDF